MTRLLLALALLLVWSPLEARQARSREVLREFQKAHPCPSTGKKTGACPGFQKDHRVPLCFYGPDAVWNLQWLSVSEHKAKTKIDIKVCGWDT